MSHNGARIHFGGFMRRIILLAIAMLLAQPAFARDTSSSDDVFFRNYVGMTKLLRTRGVDPITVNWGSIQAVCIGLKIENNLVPYNRCLYEKAIDYADFDNDRDACEARGRAEFPDRLLSRQPSVFIAGDRGNKAIYEQPLTLEDLRFKRLDAYDECMSRKGWRDTRFAARGRRALDADY
mgnify:FL=1